MATRALFEMSGSRYAIDDVYGDERLGANGTSVPIFLPVTGQWDPIGGNCSSCTDSSLSPPIDVTQVHDGTWHSCTVSSNEATTTITTNFTGTSITAYCLLPPDLGPYITTNMNMTFFLDGGQVGTYTRGASTTLDWTYNYAVYTNSSLPDGPHTFVIQPVGGVNNSLIVFDYFEYTYVSTYTSSTPSSTSSHSSTVSSSASSTSGAATYTSHQSTSAGAIAGGVVGGVVGLLLLILVAWYFLRHRPSRVSQGTHEKFNIDDQSVPIEPFVPPAASGPYNANNASQAALNSGVDSAPPVIPDFLGMAQSAAAPRALPAPPGTSSNGSSPLFLPASKAAKRQTELQRVQDMERRMQDLQNSISGGDGSMRTAPSSTFSGGSSSGSESDVRREIEELRRQVAALTRVAGAGFEEQPLDPPPMYQRNENEE